MSANYKVYYSVPLKRKSTINSGINSVFAMTVEAEFMVQKSQEKRRDKLA